MRIIREYTCDTCGATEEHFSDSDRPISQDRRPHYECPKQDKQHAIQRHRLPHLVAHLSPTATTFKFADSSARKHRR